MAKSEKNAPKAEEDAGFEEEMIDTEQEMPIEAEGLPPAEGDAQDADAILSMNEQAQVILAKAREKGIEHTFMFTTTFQRYVELISHMAELQ